MPTTTTLTLTAAAPLFFDEAWPLADLFLEILARSGKEVSVSKQGEGGKPYTLSPLQRERPVGCPSPSLNQPTRYYWQVSLLDDALTPLFLADLRAGETLTLAGAPLTIGDVAVRICAYEELARQTHSWAEQKPKAARYFDFAFITPVILWRYSLPFPLPDPTLVFQHYLAAWDTFAPRALWLNYNLLDAVEAHLAITDHQLETRTVNLGSGPPKTGFLGHATYKMLAWEKLGAEFLGQLQTLARFAEFCGTGAYTEHGLGQTRLRRSAG